MRVAVIGANGQLGRELTRAFTGWDVHGLIRPECDVRDSAAVRTLLTAIRPTVVVNTAAFTRVDDCEFDIQTAFDVHAVAVRNLACVCADLDAELVHLSTDYVFDGERRSPYGEADAPNPLNVYGVSKLAGEYFVRNICPRHLVVRTSGLYGAAGARGKGGNFVETMIRLAAEGRPIRVVDDEVLTPTYAKDLAALIKGLLERGFYGLFHVTNAGECSWFEFAGKIFGLLGLAPDFDSTTAAVFGAAARRPAYSVLAHQRLAQCGMDTMRPWAEALAAYLAETGRLQ